MSPLRITYSSMTSPKQAVLMQRTRRLAEPGRALSARAARRRASRVAVTWRPPRPRAGRRPCRPRSAPPGCGAQAHAAPSTLLNRGAPCSASSTSAGAARSVTRRRRSSRPGPRPSSPWSASVEQAAQKSVPPSGPKPTCGPRRARVANGQGPPPERPSSPEPARTCSRARRFDIEQHGQLGRFEICAAGSLAYGL